MSQDNMLDNQSRPGEGTAGSVEQISRIVEARIFASSEPVSRKDLLVYLEDESLLDDVIAEVSRRYGPQSGIELNIMDGHYAFRTAADVAPRLNLERPVKKPLSRAAMEVLAIIAYHQPVTRSEIEDIRGISLSRGTLDILLELGWIKPKGRRRTPGRPLSWGTSPAFLDHFGLSAVQDLPGLGELKAAGLLRKGQILGGLGEGVGGEQDVFTDDPAEEDRLEFNDDMSVSDLLDEEWAQSE